MRYIVILLIPLLFGCAFGRIRAGDHPERVSDQQLCQTLDYWQKRVRRGEAASRHSRSRGNRSMAAKLKDDQRKLGNVEQEVAFRSLDCTTMHGSPLYVHPDHIRALQELKGRGD